MRCGRSDVYQSARFPAQETETNTSSRGNEDFGNYRRRGRRPPRRRYTMRSGNDEGSNTQINGRNVSMFKGFQNNRERVADTVAWRGLARYSTRLVCCPSHQRRPKLFRGSSDHEHGSNKKSYGRNTGSHYIIFVLENMVMCS